MTPEEKKSQIASISLYNINTAPTVCNNLVFIGTSTKLSRKEIDVNGGRLYAIDSETGVSKWQFNKFGPSMQGQSAFLPEDRGYYQGISISTAAAGGVIYFGGFDGYIYALNSQTGEEQWKVLPPERYTSYLHGSPVIYNGALYTSYEHPSKDSGGGIYIIK